MNNLPREEQKEIPCGWTPYGEPPKGIRIQNFRKKGKDLVRIYIEPRISSRIISDFFIKGQLPSRWTLTIRPGKLNVVSSRFWFWRGRISQLHFPSIESITIGTSWREKAKFLEITSNMGSEFLAHGLSDDSLEWLKNYLVMEVSGLTWRPIVSAKKKSKNENTQELTNPVLLKPDLALRLIDIFLHQAHKTTRDLSTAVEAGDAFDIRRHAHWLKSASANVGARHLSELCQLMEMYATENILSHAQLLLKEIQNKLPAVENWLLDVRRNAAVQIAEKKKRDASPEVDKPDQTIANTDQTEIKKSVLKARVLVVDDSAVSREIAYEFLSDIVQELDFADDGEQAIASWRAAAYDLIFMDCEMIKMNGFDATREIRRQEALLGNSRIPIIALTGNVLESQREEAFEAGMDDYITKPYPPESLERTLEKWLGLRDSVAALDSVRKEMAASTNVQSDIVSLKETRVAEK